MKILNAQYVESITGIEDRKGLEHPEICFIGRSNVGKSSMINSLVMQKIARTSSTPGATRLINIYKIYYEFNGNKKSLVFSDFPGFGYSRVSKKTYQGWQGMIEGYIKTNRLIKSLIWVYDVRREFDEMDSQLISWIQDNGLKFTFVLTKADKATNQMMKARKREFSNAFGDIPVFSFSSKDGQGRQELLSHIFSLTHCF